MPETIPPAQPLTVALVNNMPDGAFVDTEEQFRAAMAPGAGAYPVTLELYAMPGLIRSDEVGSEIRSRYRTLDDLWAHPPDALILTGTEPVQAQMLYEPYWPELSQLLQWAADTVPTTLLSCLAAHASLLLFDNLERQPLTPKHCGVFNATVTDPSHPLTAGLGDTVAVPHSRVNDISETALAAAGYDVLIGAGARPSGPGWSVAVKEHGPGLFVLCQGHPEYSTASLLREYRRDVRRFLLGHGGITYPRLPPGYLRADAIAILDGFAELAHTKGPVDPVGVYEQFPYEAVLETLANPWAQFSSRFYANWLALAAARRRTLSSDSAVGGTPAGSA